MKIIAKVGVKREVGYLYDIDKQGDVSRAKMARGSKTGGRPEKVAKVGIKKWDGMVYFLTEDGNIARDSMTAKEKEGFNFGTKAEMAAKKLQHADRKSA